MKVYYKIASDRAERVLACGLDSDEYKDGGVIVGGKKQKCIFAAIVPGDLPPVRESDTVLEIEADPSKVIVAEGAFRTKDFSSFENFESVSLLYESSFVKMKDYRFGTYAKPECIITGSVLPENIKSYDSRMGAPVVYENSKSLYEEYAFYNFCEKYGDIRMYGIRCCCEVLYKAGKMKKTKVGTNLVFTDCETGEKIVIPGK